ncbi:PDR/VanB family oxidoreductase [Hoyosella altamirensis]|uniref:Ferredoxin-NADP reductase n=1 Tax=Hoyosella altamirensis TaxID=616997 RepID=A0A839RM27_9ACTN|nr:PDR/VanB family oxidoreductase [Hoyosella altamirensis]MBB3037359.1 ferredoxin-NADP reductase [Hoyosella altamirensis]
MNEVRVEPTLKAIVGAARAYRNVVVSSPVPVLAAPKPVRHSGYDFELVVQEAVAVADDVISLRLAAPDNLALPTWTPGAHLDVFLPSGRQRQYSLCGDPTDRSYYRIAVRRVPNGTASAEVHEHVKAGDSLRVRGPRNAFSFIDAPAYVLLAGGIGITPILPMFRAAAHAGVPTRLVYTGRTRASMPFVADIESIGAQSRILPDDEYGAPNLTEHLVDILPGAAVYVCGPPPMLESARTLLPQVNSTASLHMERFSAAPVRGGAPFQIMLARTGSTVDVAADETALAAIRRAFPGVAYSCQQGFCGSCKTRVLHGDVDHRDRLLTEPERQHSMLTCVSRSVDGPLILDI